VAAFSALEGNGLLRDPSIDEAREAIVTAFRQSSEDGATLFLVFIGHGEHADEDFYLLPKNASVPPFSHSAINLVQLVKELHRAYSNVDGLVVLLDTCYSGLAAMEASVDWVGKLWKASNSKLAFEFCEIVRVENRLRTRIAAPVISAKDLSAKGIMGGKGFAINPFRYRVRQLFRRTRLARLFHHSVIVISTTEALVMPPVPGSGGSSLAAAKP